MVAKTHNAIALASLITIAGIFPPQQINLTTLVGSLIGNNIGALIPDMDTSGNYLWGLLPQGHFVGRFLRKIFYKHRTITHSLLGIFLTYKFLHLLLYKLFNGNFVDINIILISIMIGFISHLVSDSLTEEGVPLLYPIPLTFGIPPIRRLRIKTGHWFENWVIFPGIWIYLFFFVQKYHPTFQELLRNIK